MVQTRGSDHGSVPPASPLGGDAARVALACLDLTSLRGDEDSAAIEALCDKAAHPAGAPAALCVYLDQVAAARRGLDQRGLSAVRVATVVSFPHGDASPVALADEVARALQAGADEIDMVLPWRALQAAALGGMASVHHQDPVPLQGLTRSSAEAAARAAVAGARRATEGHPLKVIIESGELADAALVAWATEIAVREGADFVKTSTGKARVHATLAAVQTMLDTVNGLSPLARHCGLKVAGGVQTVADVEHYLALVQAAWGASALQPASLRFGASSLWPALVAAITSDGDTVAAGTAGVLGSGTSPSY
jgi:deoxyribose-phosphate aldolase